MMEKKNHGIHLPEEIIANILSRLQLKALARFECVSTPWHALIHHPRFRSMLLRRTYCLLTQITFKQATLHLTCLDHSFKTHHFFSANISQLVSACPPLWPSLPVDGLMCFSGQIICICNPSTEEFFPLPQPFPLYTRYVNSSGPSPLAWFCPIGFGRSRLTNQYKVVRLFEPAENTDDIGCQVYTLNKDNDSVWRRVGDCPCDIQGLYAPFVEGSLHWLGNETGDDPCPDQVVGFDLEEEDFFLIPLPDYFYVHIVVLVEFRGCLCLSVHSERSWKLEMWMLKDYNECQWVKDYSIDLSPLSLCPIDILPNSRFMIPRDIRGSDGAILFEIQSRGLTWYDPKTRVFDPVQVPRSPDGRYEVFSVTCYTANLHSLKQLFHFTC